MYFITEVFRAVCQWLTFALPSHALQTWGDDSARVTICRTEVHMVEIYIQSESGVTEQPRTARRTEYQFLIFML